MSRRQPLDKRGHRERRSEDLGPQDGTEERREIPERRHPSVEHSDFDEHIELLPVDHGEQGHH